MRHVTRPLPFTLAILVISSAVLVAQPPDAPASASQTPAAQDPAMALVKQAGALNREGKHAEALGRYRQAIKLSPNLFEAHAGAGATLDLMGEYKEARAELAKAIEDAPAKSKPQALKMMAISYAFTCQPRESEKYEKQAFDLQLAAKDFYAAGETADELARIYLECGDTNAAEKWYKTGRDTGLEKPNITEAERALWDFRLEHALARIAARRGQGAEAEKHVAAAQAILGKGYGWQKQQEPFFPYLTGYVAFYLGDYKTALADLQKANQHDPFILSLIAQTYAKLGEKAQSLAYFREVLESSAHNPNNAFARPLAKKMLASAASGT